MSSKDDVLEFDTKISEDDMGGNSNSTGEFDLGTAVELLGLDDEDAKTQASKLQGAYMSFLLLRHLRLRDLQRSVRNGPYFIVEREYLFLINSFVQMSKLQGAHITFFLLRHLRDRNFKRGVINCLLFINDNLKGRGLYRSVGSVGNGPISLLSGRGRGGGSLSLCVFKFVSPRKVSNIFNRREYDLNLSVTTKKR